MEKAEQLFHTSYKTFRHEDDTTLSRAPEWSLPVPSHEHIDGTQPMTSFFRPKCGLFSPKQNSAFQSMDLEERVAVAKRDAAAEVTRALSTFVR